VRLRDLPNLVGVFVEHIGHRNEKTRPKQTALFRAQLQPLPSATKPNASARMPARAPPEAA
jgi:hypothetical protein